MTSESPPEQVSGTAFQAGSGWVLQSGLPLPALQDAINALHVKEAREIAASFGANDLTSLKVPAADWMGHSERSRLDWVDFVAVRDGEKPVEHRSGPTKSEVLMEFVRSNIGQVFTVKALVQAALCSDSTVHKVISDNPGYFKKGMFAGTYEIIDPEAVRAAEAEATAATHTLPQEAPKPTARTQPAVDPFVALINEGNATKREGTP